MNNTDIAVWSCSRVSSKRCLQKMIRPFHDTTLTDIFLKKLARLEKNIFFAGYDDIFKRKCEKYNVPFVQRTEKSALVDEPASEIYNFLTSQPYEYLLQVNACIPFLKTDTIINFIERCANDRRPSFAVIRKNNYFTGLDGTPLNFGADLTTINTKKVSPVYEFAHVFYFFRKSYFVEHGWYWDWKTINYVEIPGGLEIFDIDTEEEFTMAQAIWREIGHTVE